MKLIRLLKRDLAKESAVWVKNDLISDSQARSICAFYGASYDQPARHATGYFVLVTLGYLFVGLALITLIGANWESIPRGLRMISLILTTCVIHLTALFNYHRDRARTATALFFLGSIFYGAAIMLIAQIYHIGEHYPDGILWWAAGVLPLALLLRSRALMLLTILLAGLWFFTELDLGYFPWLFPVFLITLGFQVFRVYQSRLLFLIWTAGCILLLETCLAWFLGAFQTFDLRIDNLFFGFGLFLCCYGFARWLFRQDNPKFKDYGILLELYVLRFFILTLFVLSFKAPWYDILTADFQMPWLTTLLTGALCLVGLRLCSSADRSLLVPALVSLMILGLLTGVLFSGFHPRSMVPVFATNLILVGSGVWLIVEGIRSTTSLYFFSGVLIILATGLCRYIDLVGDYIGAAILFAVFAVILLTVAGFWRRHHRLREAGHA